MVWHSLIRKSILVKYKPEGDKEPGDSFEEGETLVEVQTDKVAFEVPEPFSGTLAEIKVKRGETAKTGEVIATAK